MGKALSTARRFVRNFDVEARAMKYIEKSKSKAVAAPKHPNTPKENLDQHSLKQLFDQNPDLDRRVDLFKIDSSAVKQGILPEGVDYVPNSSRRLPQKVHYRDPFPDPPTEFGFVIPEVVPRGRLTMRQAVNLVKAYQTKTATIEQLSDTYHLDQAKVASIVDYFVLFVQPSNGYWFPPMLLSNKTEETKLLDEPISTPEDDDLDPIGGPAHAKRRDALRGFDEKS